MLIDVGLAKKYMRLHDNEPKDCSTITWQNSTEQKKKGKKEKKDPWKEYSI